MDAKGVLRGDFARAQMVTNMLLDGLEDADLFVRTSPSANHLAWQLGHLIASANMMGESIRGGSMPALPAGFAENHAKDTAGSDDAGKFLGKDAYIKLMDEQRQALVELLGQLSDSDLDAEGPERMRQIAPTVGDVLGLAASHELMHSGQITSVRRQLNKPVAF